MSRVPEVAPLCRSVTLALLVGATLALVLPSMLTVGADPVNGAVAVLTLALAALVGLGLHRFGGHARPVGPTQRLDGAPVLVLSGRVTDPTHHPVRPRAPGSAT